MGETDLSLKRSSATHIGQALLSAGILLDLAWVVTERARSANREHLTLGRNLPSDDVESIVKRVQKCSATDQRKQWLRCRDHSDRSMRFIQPLHQLLLLAGIEAMSSLHDQRASRLGGQRTSAPRRQRARQVWPEGDD